MVATEVERGAEGEVSVTRPILTKHPPRRSKCKACGAAIWRLSIGSWGQSINFDREGNKLLRTDAAQHRCPKEVS